jgi:hypothetical protein
MSIFKKQPKWRHLPKVKIVTIDHSSQRYPSVGDWQFEESVQDGTTLVIRVSKMSDWRYEFLVALHELVEVALCSWGGVTQKQVDKFDIDFEKKRKPGNVDEPGDDIRAPYRFQHGIASGVERIAGAILGVDWNKYADEVENL